MVQNHNFSPQVTASLLLLGVHVTEVQINFLWLDSNLAGGCRHLLVAPQSMDGSSQTSVSLLSHYSEMQNYYFFKHF